MSSQALANPEEMRWMCYPAIFVNLMKHSRGGKDLSGEGFQSPRRRVKIVLPAAVVSNPLFQHPHANRQLCHPLRRKLRMRPPGQTWAASRRPPRARPAIRRPSVEPGSGLAICHAARDEMSISGSSSSLVVTVRQRTSSGIDRRTCLSTWQASGSCKTGRRPSPMNEVAPGFRSSWLLKVQSATGSLVYQSPCCIRSRWTSFA